MRTSTTLAALVVLAALGGVVVVTLTTTSGQGGDLSVRWTSDTAVPVQSNHHAVAAGRVDGKPMVFAPVSGSHNTTACRLVALNGTTGDPVWRHHVPPRDCTIHSVATLTLGDYDDDGVREVLAPTTEDLLYVFSPLSGDRELVHPLSKYGYSPAAVGHLTDGSHEQIGVVDTNATAYVLYPNGTVAWSRYVDSYVWAQPRIDDFTDAPGNEFVVPYGRGWVTMYRGDGSVAWNVSRPIDGSITWVGYGDANGDGTTDIAVATTKGTVVALDGRTGESMWTGDFDAFAAVHAVADGDGDGQPEVYATARDGKLRALDAATGSIEWTTTLTTEDVQMTPPPAVGDLDGDGHPELVAATNDGVVSVVDPQSGEVLASYEREVPIWVWPTVADTDGDGADEIFVMYGDGRVVSLSYRSG